MLDAREKEVMECFMHGWIQGEMPLHGGLSYQDAIDLMQKFGIDASPIERELEQFQDLFKKQFPAL